MPGRGVYWKVDGSNKTGVAFEQLDGPLQAQVTTGGGGGGHVIQDEGSGLPQEAILDFTGNAVIASDGTGKTRVDINRYIIKNEVGTTLPPAGGEPPIIQFGGDLRGVNAEGQTEITNSKPAHTIENEGASLPQQGQLDFVGSGVTATDGPGNRTTITIPGSVGKYQLIGSAVADGTSTTLDVAVSPPILLDGTVVSKFVAIATTELVGGGGSGDIGYIINEINTGTSYALQGAKISPAPFASISNVAEPQWRTGESDGEKDTFAIIEISGKQDHTPGEEVFGGLTAHIKETTSFTTLKLTIASAVIRREELSLNSFQLKNVATPSPVNFAIGSRLDLYKVLK